MAEDKCVSEAEEIYNELKKIKEKIENLSEDDPKALYEFKPYYDELLKVLEKSKELASCPVPAIKIYDKCQYMSPLEPLFFADYTTLPNPNEPYTIIDDVRRFGKQGRLTKIKDLLDDVVTRLEAYLGGVKECAVELPQGEEDIDSMMMKLGINPDEFLEDGEEVEENKSES